MKGPVVMHWQRFGRNGRRLIWDIISIFSQARWRKPQNASVRCRGRDAKWAPPENKSRLLPPHQPAQNCKHVTVWGAADLHDVSGAGSTHVSRELGNITTTCLGTFWCKINTLNITHVFKRTWVWFQISVRILKQIPKHPFIHFFKVPTRWHFVQYFIISCNSLYMFRA
jgi:hypothetical protein